MDQHCTGTVCFETKHNVDEKTERTHWKPEGKISCPHKTSIDFSDKGVCPKLEFD